MPADILIFSALLAAAAVFFVVSCYFRFSLVALGRPDQRFDELGRRFSNMLLFAFGQKKVVTRRYPFGLNHAVFFWCFLILLAANTEFLLHGLFPSAVSISLLPDGAYFALALIFDVVSFLALAAVVIALARRLFFPPKYIEARTPDAFVILGLVGSLMLAYFILHGSQIALGEERAAAFMPFSSLFGLALSGLPVAALAAVAAWAWWVHAVTLLGFLDYLPYSKHMHILTSIPNCFFKSLDKVNTPAREEFRKGNVYGVGSVERFRWKDLFDSFSCTECGRCTSVCPASASGKQLNPRMVIHDIKVNLLHNGRLLRKGAAPELPLIGERREGSVAEGDLWDCTTCGACMEVCPVFIEHVPKIVGMRRHLVEMNSTFPGEVQSLFENMEQRGNPWGIIPAERGKWAAEVAAPAFEKGRTEYLFFAGCTGAFDTRNKRNTEALARIFNRAGISWGTLGKDEKCCGDSVRRLGNEYVFEHMAADNSALLSGLGARTIITQCPHCYNTLKNDYRQYGLQTPVVHYTEFIFNLIEAGKITLKPPEEPRRLVFHDSCYLGRYNGIYSQPRQLIELATGHPPLEMEKNRDASFCCGAGGGHMWMEESAETRVNMERTRQALELKPEAICVCCPYCVTMMEDGLTDLKVAENIVVTDLSELIEKALQ